MILKTAAVVGLVVVLSCTNPTEGCGCTPVPVLSAGTWTATQFTVTPTGQGQIDILAAGGSLTIVILANFATSGSLVIPAAVNGGTPFTASMAGTVTYSSTTLRATFAQAADTFVRDLSWELTNAGTTLSVSNQTAGGASYTITLTEQ